MVPVSRSPTTDVFSMTYPYSDGLGSIKRDSLGKVVLIADLGNGRRGIAVDILMPVYLGGNETLR